MAVPVEVQDALDRLPLYNSRAYNKDTNPHGLAWPGNITEFPRALTDFATASNYAITLGDIVAEIGAISGDITTVAAIASEIVTVASINIDVTTVAARNADIATVAARDANIGTVAARDTDIATVASIDGDITTVAGIHTNVTTVAVRDADIATVAARDVNIGTVAARDADIAIVASRDAGIATVAARDADIVTVVARDTDIGIVADRDADIAIVASRDAGIATVAARDADIAVVVSIDADISTVAGISANVTAVGANNTNITTVATDIADIQTAAANMSAILAAPGAASDAASSKSVAEGAAALAVTKAGEASDSADEAANVVLTFDYKGDYLAGVTYEKNNLVTDQGSSWYALQTTVGNAPPTLPITSDSNWKVAAIKGIDGTGIGDMTIVTYDPNGIIGDVFDMTNMVEGSDSKIMTLAEREKLATMETGAEVNTVNSVSGKTGDVLLTKADVGLDNVSNIADWGRIVGGFVIEDTRAIVSSPDDFIDQTGKFEFKAVASVGSPPQPSTALYAHVLSINGWKADGTGGWPTQISFGEGLSFRKGASETTWDPWKLLLTADDVGTAAAEDVGYFATSAQGVLAGTALQSDDIGVTLQGFDANTAKINIIQSWSKPQRASVVALTSAATITIALADGNDFSLTLGDNAVLDNPSDIATYVGQKGSISGEQDATGGRTLGVGSYWYPIGSDVMPEIPVGPNDKFRVDFHVVSATRIDFSASGVGVAA